MRPNAVTRAVGPHVTLMLVLASTAWTAQAPTDQRVSEQDQLTEPSSGTLKLTLEQCQSTALRKSHRRPASQFTVAMAEAQHRQALAGYWPQVNVKGGYQRLDQPLNFIFPATAMQIPSQSIAVPGGAALVTIPANAFGPGFLRPMCSCP